jgi:hypothetical protein
MAKGATAAAWVGGGVGFGVNNVLAPAIPSTSRARMTTAQRAHLNAGREVDLEVDVIATPSAALEVSGMEMGMPSEGSAGEVLTRPWLMAYKAASVRESTPILAKILRRWTLTVFGEMNNFRAISLLLRPVATSRRISSSRSLRSLFSGEGMLRLYIKVGKTPGVLSDIPIAMYSSQTPGV